MVGAEGGSAGRAWGETELHIHTYTQSPGIYFGGERLHFFFSFLFFHMCTISLIVVFDCASSRLPPSAQRCIF